MELLRFLLLRFLVRAPLLALASMKRTRSLLAGIAFVMCAGVAAPPALAHGDLASEYLVKHDIFLPPGVRVPASLVARLATAVHQLDSAQLPVKFALIAIPPDLAKRRAFFGKPQQYAEWVSQDINADYHGHLLVVMPVGYGAAVDGGIDPRLQRAGVTLGPPGPAPQNMVRGAITVLDRWAAEYGHRLSLTPARGASDRTTSDRIKIAAIALGAIAVTGVVAFVRRRRSGGLRAAGTGRS